LHDNTHTFKKTSIKIAVKNRFLQTIIPIYPKNVRQFYNSL